MFLTLTVILIIQFSLMKLTSAQTYLRADISKDAYNLISSVFGGNAVEDPDCAHASFGHHIRQVVDKYLNRAVFLFYIHVTPDNDRCRKFDRQRNEIKTYGPSPEKLKGRKGESVSYSWNFFLDTGFKPSRAFTSILQIKDRGGNIGSPILSINMRYNARGNRFELIHVNSEGKRVLLKTVELKVILGSWIHVVEHITYDTEGKYSIIITSLNTGSILLEYQNSKIDFWRKNATFVRPKWGIYRGLNDKSRLRDEAIRFDTFCLGKEKQTCS